MILRMSTLLICGLGLCLLGLFYVTLPPNQQAPCVCKAKPESLMKTTIVSQAQRNSDKLHNMAVLVPFRDRFEELMQFAPYLHSYLNEHGKNHHIFIINQVDNLRFNRASLLNVGFKEVSSKNYDHIALHDVDLIPINNKLIYHYPNSGPYHLAAPYLHPRYHYPTFIGGVLIIKKDHFKSVNGMSNKYWGWGLEDDEFYARLKEGGLKIYRPANFSTGIKNSFRHIHDRKVRKRDMIKCHNQQEITRRRDRQTGLSNLAYTMESVKELSIDGAPVTILNVILHCNKTVMPWCDCTNNVGNKPRTEKQKIDRTDVIMPKINRAKHITLDG